MTPALADPEVAALLFEEHLDDFLKRPRSQRRGFKRVAVISPLISILCVPGIRADATSDLYYLRLEADHYDQYPAEVRFVRPPPDGDESWAWPDARNGMQSYPRIESVPWFRLHDAYNFKGLGVRQLVCFSHTFGYYVSGHNPTASQRWRQGYHTVAATLSRIGEVLAPPNYRGPSGDSC